MDVKIISLMLMTDLKEHLRKNELEKVKPKKPVFPGTWNLWKNSFCYYLSVHYS
jgi:hypothetical protein